MESLDAPKCQGERKVPREENIQDSLYLVGKKKRDSKEFSSQ